MRRAVVLALLQVAFMLGWAGHHERAWANAPTFRVPLRPLDGRAVMGGRHVGLWFLDADLDTGRAGSPLATAEVARFLPAGQRGYSGPAEVGFCAEKDLWRVCALRAPGAAHEPGPEFWSTVHLRIGPTPRGYTVSAGLGPRRLFIPDRLDLPAPETAEGWQLEVSHRPGMRLLPRRLWFEGRPLGS